MTPFATLEGFTAHLMQGEVASHGPQNESWAGLFTEGKTSEIDEETWTWFLECLPPKWMSGNSFAFAEGAEPLRLFWRRQGKHFVRQLTWDETREFCRRADILVPC